MTAETKTIMANLGYDLFGDLTTFSGNKSDNSSSSFNTTMASTLNSASILVATPLPPSPPQPQPQPLQPALCDSKKQERAIKNRESAQASRERKRRYVDELEASREAFQEESRNLRSRVDTLELEKSSLIGELSVLRREFEQLKRVVLDKDFGANADSTFKSDPHSEQHVHGDKTLSSSIRSVAQTGSSADLPAQSRVWRPHLDGTLTPLTTPAHSPSANGHLIVSSGVAGSPDQPLNHVLRLRLRYRRRLTDSTPRKMTRTCGSAPGKNILAERQRKKAENIKKAKKSGRYLMSRQNLKLLWNRIFSGYKTRVTKMKKRPHK